MDHPYDGDAPNNSIDPTLDGGAPMAAVVAVNTTNGCDLLFNASGEIGDIPTITPLQPITINTNPNTYWHIVLQYLLSIYNAAGLGREGELNILHQYFYSVDVFLHRGGGRRLGILYLVLLYIPAPTMQCTTT